MLARAGVTRVLQRVRAFGILGCGVGVVGNIGQKALDLPQLVDDEERKENPEDDDDQNEGERFPGGV